MQIDAAQERAGRKAIGLAMMAAAVALLMVGLWGGAAAGKTVRVTGADDRHRITVARGDILVVSLASTPGSGFSWQPAGVDSKILRPQGDPELIRPARPMPGAPATQVFRFLAAAAGTTSLRLNYVRPWERDKPAARTFRIDLIVR